MTDSWESRRLAADSELLQLWPVLPISEPCLSPTSPFPVPENVHAQHEGGLWPHPRQDNHSAERDVNQWEEIWFLPNLSITFLVSNKRPAGHSPPKTARMWPVNWKQGLINTSLESHTRESVDRGNDWSSLSMSPVLLTLAGDVMGPTVTSETQLCLTVSFSQRTRLPDFGVNICQAPGFVWGRTCKHCVGGGWQCWVLRGSGRWNPHFPNRTESATLEVWDVHPEFQTLSCKVVF